MKRRESFMGARGLREAIHDDLGPKLFAVATKLRALRAALTGEAARRADEAAALVQEAREEARRLVQGRGQEARIDLRRTLATLAREHGGSFADFSGGKKVADAAALELLGIAREAAHNAVKHGQAGEVKIRLHAGRLEVEDNGLGPSQEAGIGFGMAAMKRRARRLGGRVTLQRVAPGRTVLTCLFGPGEK